jgi:hypothetical protein
VINRHEHIGKGVIRVMCEVNGQNAKRINQPAYYPNPVWSVNDRIVANWFSDLLEIAYKHQMEGLTPTIHQNYL